MTMIANYFAQVGVGVDKKSLANVNKLLGDIEKRMKSFSSRVGKSTTINVDIKLNQSKLNGQVQRALNQAGRTATLNISRVNFGQKVRDRLNNLTSRAGRQTISINATISSQSLNSMRAQVRNALNNITVSPNISPRVRNTANAAGGGSNTTGKASTSSRSRNPFHNPMMIGGGVGAFMRYGAFSLPFVAGTLGLNALSNKSAKLQNQDLMMDVSMGAFGDATESAGYKKFLSDLGDRLGRTTESMTPFFAQMLSGSKGTALEPHLQSGFESLMSFGSVMGLDDQAMKGTIKAFSQMIGKQQIMA